MQKFDESFDIDFVIIFSQTHEWNDKAVLHFNLVNQNEFRSSLAIDIEN